MSYTYSSFVTVLAERLSVPTNDPDFVTDLAAIIDDAEQRIYRELDLLSTIVRDTSASTTANNRTFSLPSALGRFVVVEEINVVVNGVRNPLVSASKEVINWSWPSDTAPGSSTVPTMFGMLSDQTVLFGPPPGSVWPVEVIGTIRPNTLSATNTTTFLSQFLSDLFLAAAMVSATGGLLRNYGASSDDPRMAVSWSAQYDKLMASAQREEIRKKFGSSSWTSKSPAMATPERG